MACQAKGTLHERVSSDGVSIAIDTVNPKRLAYAHTCLGMCGEAENHDLTLLGRRRAPYYIPTHPILSESL